MTHTPYKKFGMIVLGLIATVSLYPATTNAQASSGASSLASGAASCAVGAYISSQLTGYVSGLFGSVTSGSNAVPTNSAFENQKLAKQDSKNFTLDRLASCAAKQLLHQITADTVSWINTGFRGGPAFLQNPRGFLLNSADQLTGAFISDSGLLQGLCSPWNVDLRLTLALETSNNGNFNNAQYSCTLSKIIGQAKNASIDGFINGDFKQGGWGAFMDMTVGSQNPATQYLLAKSGIQAAINQKTQEINNDLQQGMGFISSEKCTDVPADQIGQINAGEIWEGVDIIPNEDGTFQQCVKTTPGSYIAHALNVHTDSGIVESELANDINAVTSALFTQLTNQLLQKGLASLSGSGSGAHFSGSSNLNTFVNQLQVAAYSPQTVNAADGSTFTVQNGSVAQTTTPENQVTSTYTTALSTLNATRGRYTSASDCFTLIVSSGSPNASQASYDRTAIANTIASKLDPVIASTTQAKGEAVVSTQGGVITPADTSKAQSALTTAQATSAQLDPDANQYMNACENMNNASSNIDNGQ